MSGCALVRSTVRRDGGDGGGGPAFGPVVSPRDSRFHGGDMTPRIAATCRDAGQAPPASENLPALCPGEPGARYRWVAETPRPTSTKAARDDPHHWRWRPNRLLDQLAADATGRTVVTRTDRGDGAGQSSCRPGPWATSAQWRRERDVVKASFDHETLPRDTHGWDIVAAATSRSAGVDRRGGRAFGFDLQLWLRSGRAAGGWQRRWFVFLIPYSFAL